MRNDLRNALLQRFEACLPPLSLRDDVRGYTRDPVGNLLPALADDALLADFAGGDGGELRGARPRFCAAHSSAALATNSFGPYRFHPERLSLAGVEGFEVARFGKRLGAGLRGRAPNLDFFASGPGGVVGVEAKFTEPFVAKTTGFTPRYQDAVERLAEPAWADVFRSLLAEPRHFVYLDAAQLVKHYLGMRNGLPRDGRPKVLMYLYWEPSNAGAVVESLRHRDEVETFARCVAGSEIRFTAATYAEVWDDMIARGAWAGERLHVEALRARYEFPVISSGN